MHSLPGREMARGIHLLHFHGSGTKGNRAIVVVNYSQNQGQCRLRLPFGELGGEQWRLQDMMSENSYDRDGNELLSQGLWLDMPAWGYHVFDINKL